MSVSQKCLVKMYLPKASLNFNERMDSFSNESRCCQDQEKANLVITLSFSPPTFSHCFAAGLESYNH